MNHTIDSSVVSTLTAHGLTHLMHPTDVSGVGADSGRLYEDQGHLRHK